MTDSAPRLSAASTSATSLRIDIVSDVVCPWCIVGYLQLRRALDRVGGDIEVQLHWQPFELNPQMPTEGQDLAEHIAQKYGATAAQRRGTRQRLIDAGAELGFEFNYGNAARIVNTFQAHQLLYWAAQLSLQTELKLALFKAFFTDGQDVSQSSVLVSVAESVGLPSSQAREILADHRYADSVRAEQQYWLNKDVHAVPAFSFNQQYPLPGAQGEETFVRFLKKVIARGEGA